MYTPDLVLKVIPQRYPFLMVDKIIEQSFQQYAVCQKNITLGEEVLSGHFKNNPIYPGVLLIEMGLQTTQVMMTDIDKVLLRNDDDFTKIEQGYMLSVDKYKFHKPVRPGDILMIRATFQGAVIGMIKSEIKITNQDNEDVAGGTVVVSGEK